MFNTSLSAISYLCASSICSNKFVFFFLKISLNSVWRGNELFASSILFVTIRAGERGVVIVLKSKFIASSFSTKYLIMKSKLTKSAKYFVEP